MILKKGCLSYFCTTIVYQQQISKLQIWTSTDFLPNWNVISFVFVIIFFVNQNLEIFTEKDKIMINHKMCEIGKKTN